MNGLSDVEYAQNRAWLASNLAAHPHACWLIANPEKCWKPVRFASYCAALAAPGHEVYLYADITFRDAFSIRNNAKLGLPPTMTGCQPTPISARADRPQKVDYSAITREIAGRG